MALVSTTGHQRKTDPPRWGVAVFLLVFLGAALVVGLRLFAASILSSSGSPGNPSAEVRTDHLVPSGSHPIQENVRQ